MPVITNWRPGFEHYMSEDGKYPKAIERSRDGGYVLMQAQSAWVTWQAACEWMAAQQAAEAP